MESLSSDEPLSEACRSGLFCILENCICIIIIDQFISQLNNCKPGILVRVRIVKNGGLEIRIVKNGSKKK